MPLYATHDLALANAPEPLADDAPCAHCPHPLEDHAHEGSFCLDADCDCAGFDLDDAR